MAGTGHGTNITLLQATPVSTCHRLVTEARRLLPWFRRV